MRRMPADAETFFSRTASATKTRPLSAIGWPAVGPVQDGYGMLGVSLQRHVTYVTADESVPCDDAIE
jgi:hypothetical protein